MAAPKITQERRNNKHTNQHNKHRHIETHTPNANKTNYTFKYAQTNIRKQAIIKQAQAQHHIHHIKDNDTNKQNKQTLKCKQAKHTQHDKSHTKQTFFWNNSSKYNARK